LVKNPEGENRYCLILEYQDENGKEDFTRIHGNETMLALDIPDLKGSTLEVLAIHAETNALHFAFRTKEKIINWRCEDYQL
jgi:hypothetical protein